MKKIISIFGIISSIIIFLTGCTSSQPKAGNTSQPKTKSNNSIVIKGNTFSGKVMTDNNGKQEMTVHFDKNNHAIVTYNGISKSDSTWTRKIISGRYAISGKTLGVIDEDGMILGYNSEKSLANQKLPTKMVKKHDRGSTTELKIHKRYLAFNEKYKLYPTKTTIISNYNDYIDKMQKQYNKNTQSYRIEVS
ncbi:hypothetical protein D1B17_06135 [Companilactobacillus zhachilii]|uniref:Lipoprotein n=1 Tax=Companilactobacillus zhachilii TaxID=2304606 RepID=A0A386PQN6_9LACO|nr:hypothetical protein [Companilactobacillus zhachilii]AYE38231.1 hypothetical protein D1B17_06135 [Companilactobacillus zhachilii]